MTRMIAMGLATMMLAGCSVFGFRTTEPVTIKKEEVARTPLNLPDPAPLKPRSPEWMLITPENAEAVWQRLRDSNTDLVLLGLTDDGYERLALDQAEIRVFIAQLRAILQKYRDYYEPAKPAPAPAANGPTQ